MHSSLKIDIMKNKKLKELSNTRAYLLRKPIGQLVLLGFDITAFTPVTYQRGHLPRPSRDILS